MEPVIVSIGTEPMQWVAGKVLESSIRRRTDRPLFFHYSWTPDGGWSHRLKEIPEINQGTTFNMWRWVTPAVALGSPRVVYCDADQVCLADVAGLYDYDIGSCSIGAVVGAEGYFDRPDGGKVILPDAIQTSVMVMDVARCDWNAVRMAKQVRDGKFMLSCFKLAKNDYAAMMQACWLPLDAVCPLEKGWNHFNIVEEGRTKIVHWTCVRSQPYRKPRHPTALYFKRELKLALQDRIVTPEEVRDAVKKKHLHKAYLPQ